MIYHYLFILMYHDLSIFITAWMLDDVENWKLHLVWETNDLAMWYDIPRYQKTGDIRDASKQT